MSRREYEGPFAADLSLFPILQLRSPHVASYEHVSIASYFDCVDRGLARLRPFVIMHDMRDIPPVDDARRVEFMEMLAARRPQVVRLLRGYGAVAESPLERGIVTAFAWFAQVPFPVRTFSSEADAEAWLQERLEAPAPRRAQTSQPV
jgi:hypothetical protein